MVATYSGPSDWESLAVSTYFFLIGKIIRRQLLSLLIIANKEQNGGNWKRTSEVNTYLCVKAIRICFVCFPVWEVQSTKGPRCCNVNPLWHLHWGHTHHWLLSANGRARWGYLSDAHSWETWDSSDGWLWLEDSIKPCWNFLKTVSLSRTFPPVSFLFTLQSEGAPKLKLFPHHLISKRCCL